MTDHPKYRRGGATRWVAVLCVAWAGRGFAETHPATWVPSQAAAFIVAPNLAGSVGKFDAFLREVKPGFPGFDLAEFEMTAGFAPGVMDLSKPVMIIADRPEELMRLFSGAGLSEGDATWPVIGFTPADADAFQKMLRDDHNGKAQSIVGAFGRYRVIMRDGVAFVAAKRSALSRIATLDADASAYAGMSDAARSDATSADIYMQFSMGAWRPLYESKLRAVVELMKLGFRAQPGDAARAEQVRKLSDWFFSNALDGVQQMDSVAVGLSFDGERFRLDHHHSFRQNDWMADYLGKVTRRDDVKHWRAFPDESFLFAMSSNWNVPSESCFAVRFNRRCMNDPALCRDLTRQQRLELDQNIAALTNATSVEEFILTSPPGRLAPFQMRGAYLAKDAGRILGVMQKVRAHSQEIVGSIIPGAAELAGKTHLTKVDGMDVYQIRLVDASESQMVRNNIAGMYGAEALYQETVVGDDTIVYTIGGKNGVRDLANVLAGKAPSMTGNARVLEEMTAMPADANLYALMDTSRFVSSIPLLMRAGMGAPPPDRTIGVSDTSADRIGPLLGWSATVRRNHVDAAFTMKARDLRETIDAFRRLKDSLESPPGAGGGSNSELAADRPLPFVMGD